MARTEIERVVLPSLLDRLTDDDPRTPADPQISRDESVRRYRASVLRDVEWLLNTRGPLEAPPEALVELRRSAYAYGLPDTTGLAANTPDGRQLLTRWVAEVLAAFEPRLSGVQVTMSEVDQVRSPQLHFMLTALLRMDPSPEQVMFDTVLDLASGGYQVHDNRAPAGAAA